MWTEMGWVALLIAAGVALWALPNFALAMIAYARRARTTPITAGSLLSQFLGPIGVAFTARKTDAEGRWARKALLYGGVFALSVCLMVVAAGLLRS
jgi:hypothetical protein